MILILSLFFCKEPIENETDFSHLKIAYPSDPSSIDPLFATDLTSEKLIPLLYSTLFRMDENGNPSPYLAESWNWDPAKNKLKINLPDSIPASLVQQSLNRLITVPGPRKDYYRFILNVEVSGKNTLDLRLRAGMKEVDILRRLSLASSAIQGDTGPYQLVDWRKSNSLLLKKNHSLNHPRISLAEYPDSLEILIIPRSTIGLFLFLKGKLDSIKLSDFLLNHPITRNKKVLEKKGRSVQYVAINNTNPCFDIHFRKAVNLAIDREKIIQTILENNAEVTITSIPASRLKFSKKNYTPEAYNPRLALSELEKSKCYPDILKKELDFRMRADDENMSKGRAVAQFLKDIGLQIKIRGMEKAPLYKENGEGKGDFTFLTWYADYPSPMAFLDPVFHSQKHGNGGNRSFFSHKKLDEYIEAEDLEAAIRLLLEEKPWIFLWSIHENYLVSDKVLKFPLIQQYL